MRSEKISCPPCGKSCTAPNWDDESLQWCSFEVQPPATAWHSLDAEAGPNASSDKRVATALKDIDIYVVAEEDEVGGALNALYASMRDPMIGIDTEWKPDSKQEDNDVAMIQLASSSVVVLIRTCIVGIPQALIDFCRDDEIIGVGFSWDNSDERKMQSSFDLGRRELFTHFIDVKIQAEQMGYYNVGVNSLAQLLLDFYPPTSKLITLSDWESSNLNPRQVRYAAMDALVTGDLFRQLRCLHARPQPCPGCGLLLGEWPGHLDLSCQHPECCTRRPFASVTSLLTHTKSKRHPSNVFQCKECQRCLYQQYSHPAATAISHDHPLQNTPPYPPYAPVMEQPDAGQNSTLRRHQGNQGRKQRNKDRRLFVAYNTY